jgi:hypothetical protein
MEIPGIAPLSGQPTLTNPLNQESVLEGRQAPAQSGSETQNTTSVSDQKATDLSSVAVVNEATQTAGAELKSDNPATINLDVFV